MNTTNPTTSNYRWFVLSMGVLAQITFAVGFAGIPVSGVIMRSEYHFTLSQLGFVLGCMGLGVAISEIIWGMLTDKLGDKIVLLIGLVSMGAVFLVISLGFVPSANRVPDYRALGALLILAGSVGGSINSSSGSAVMTWFSDQERGFAMSIRQTAIPVGAAIGSILFPYIASVYGFGHAFLTLAVLCFLVTACIWLWLKEQKTPQVPELLCNSGLKSPLKRVSVWRIAIAGAALTFPQIAVLTFSSTFLSDQNHLSLGIISTIVFCMQIGSGCLRLLLGRITDRYQNRRTVFCSVAVLAGIASILLGLLSGQSPFVTVPFLVLTGLAGNAWHGIGYTEIAVTAGVRYAGRALGMLGATVFAVSFIVPYTIPFILQFSSWDGVWIVVGVVSLLAFPLMLEAKKQTSNKQTIQIVRDGM